jgi:hypothetical protein
MGYGIKLLIIQRPNLPKDYLVGGKDELGFVEQIQIEDDMVHKLQKDLYILSSWTIGFIRSCETLFKIYGDDDDDWDEIYVWKYKYTQMQWNELKAEIEPLVEKYLEEEEEEYKRDIEEAKIEIIDYDPKIEIIYALQKLINVSHITNKFQIS